MDEIVEMTLSRVVNVTNTNFVRAKIQERVDADGLDGPPIELVRFHVFIHCTRGSGRHMVDFCDIEMNPGSAIWIRPGQVQRWSNSDDDFDADVVVFDSSVIPELPLFDHFIGTTSITQLGADTNRLQQQIEWMTADLESNQDHAVAAAVVGVVLRLFARQAKTDDSSNAPGQQLAKAFVDSIDLNIGERSVAWHAQRIGASTRSVARATAASLNQRPKEVIDARVILEARRRLAWSDSDIAIVARELRFSEASNFTKFFRSRTGVSPSHFRAIVASMNSSGGA